MKQLVCEMCGGTDILKQDGYFVCQNCGVKYQPEEARKMLAEIQGTVQIDRSCEIENMMKNADATYSDKNYRAAYDLYTQILNIDPNNTEVTLKKNYAALNQASVDEYHINEVYRSIERVTKMKHCQTEDTCVFFRFCTGIFDDIDKTLSTFYSEIYSGNDEIWIWCCFLEKFLAVISELVQDYAQAEDGYYESAISSLQKSAYYYSNMTNRYSYRDFTETEYFEKINECRINIGLLESRRFG